MPDYILLDELAWYSKELPKTAGTLDQIYYHMTRSIYASVKNGTIDLTKAKNLKLSLAHYFEKVVEAATWNGKMICELGKLTAPACDLNAKSREELLDIVLKMQALLSGLMKTAEDELPDIMKTIKEDE